MGRVWHTCRICESDNEITIFPSEEALIRHKQVSHGLPSAGGATSSSLTITRKPKPGQLSGVSISVCPNSRRSSDAERRKSVTDDRKRAEGELIDLPGLVDKFCSGSGTQEEIPKETSRKRSRSTSSHDDAPEENVSPQKPDPPSTSTTSPPELPAGTPQPGSEPQKKQGLRRYNFLQVPEKSVVNYFTENSPERFKNQAAKLVSPSASELPNHAKDEAEALEIEQAPPEQTIVQKSKSKSPSPTKNLPTTSEPQSQQVESVEIKRKRGRPRKYPKLEEQHQNSADVQMQVEANGSQISPAITEPPIKRKRGRPPKYPKNLIQEKLIVLSKEEEENGVHSEEPQILKPEERDAEEQNLNYNGEDIEMISQNQDEDNGDDEHEQPENENLIQNIENKSQSVEDNDGELPSQNLDENDENSRNEEEPAPNVEIDNEETPEEPTQNLATEESDETSIQIDDNDREQGEEDEPVENNEEASQISENQDEQLDETLNDDDEEEQQVTDNENPKSNTENGDYLMRKGPQLSEDDDEDDDSGLEEENQKSPEENVQIEPEPSAVSTPAAPSEFRVASSLNLSEESESDEDDHPPSPPHNAPEIPAEELMESSEARDDAPELPEVEPEPLAEPTDNQIELTEEYQHAAAQEQEPQPEEPAAVASDPPPQELQPNLEPQQVLGSQANEVVEKLSSEQNPFELFGRGNPTPAPESKNGIHFQPTTREIAEEHHIDQDQHELMAAIDSISQPHDAEIEIQPVWSSQSIKHVPLDIDEAPEEIEIESSDPITHFVTEQKKGRGRPRKNKEEGIVVARKSLPPRVTPRVIETEPQPPLIRLPPFSSPVPVFYQDSTTTTVTVMKRGRGRPKKENVTTPPQQNAPKPPKKNKRGRPPNTNMPYLDQSMEDYPPEAAQFLLSPPFSLPPELEVIPNSRPAALTEKKPYACAQCGKCFSTKGGLNGHELLHSDDSGKLHSCEFCNEKFRFATGLQYHISSRHADKPYSCDYCPKRFPNLFTLKSHTRTHTGEKPYQCKYCPEKFAHHAAMMHHMKKHHQDAPLTTRDGTPKQRKPRAPKAAMNSNSTQKVPPLRIPSLKARQAAARSDSFPCDYCENSFPTNETLISHTRTHTGQKPYSCDLCGQDFTSYGGYTCHRNKVHAVIERSSNAAAATGSLFDYL